MTTSSPPDPVVVCADNLRALYPAPKRLAVMSLTAVAICGASHAVGSLFHMVWLGTIGIAVVGGMFVVPHLVGIQRFLNSLPCSACGLPAGRY